MEIAKERPPYVVFEVQAVEDRNASIAAGHYVSKDVVFAVITPQGSKDRLPRVATEWLEMLKAQVQEGRFPDEWYRAFQRAHDAYLQGQELPENGTAVKNWPGASPAQVQTLLNFGLRTVEDLAAANEEALSRLGMGGRALKQKAVEWLASSQDLGKQSEKITQLTIENDQLREQITAQSKSIADLSSKVEALLKKA